MKNKTLLRTNILVCAIITVGFIATSIIGYQSNFSMFELDTENVSTLASEGIFYQIDSNFTKPVSVSVTMANDSLLKNFLSGETEHMDDESFVSQLRDYLLAYQEKYKYNSVFLVSANTSRYYHFKGLDRVLEQGNPENVWYYDFLENPDEYALNVDNDQAVGAQNEITVFVNCKIKDSDGSTMGVVGVGIVIDQLQALLREYDEEFDVTACLVDNDGNIQISSERTGYEQVNLFDGAAYADDRDRVLNDKEEKLTFWYHNNRGDGYVVSQYVPNLKWHLVVEKDTSAIDRHLQRQFAGGVVIIVVIIALVLIIITAVIRKYNARLLELTVGPELEYQRLLHGATQGLYENIFEIDITNQRACGESTRQYFESLGMSGNTPYEDAIRVIAQKELREDFIQEYLDTFRSTHVLEVYNSGLGSMSYDFLVHKEDCDYRWVRIIAQIFYWSSDQSVRMITYRKDIDAEKRRELALLEKSQRDSLSGLYNKRTTEDLIGKALGENREDAFLIIDIDDFKTVNDNRGHAFGDLVLSEFSAELKSQFRDTDIVGRIGGDEFVALLRDYGGEEALHDTLKRLQTRLTRKYADQSQSWEVACSIGVSLFPKQGCTYTELYEKADQALYYAKGHGKGICHVFDGNPDDSAAFHTDARDMEALLNCATDGISKVACMGGNFKMLYFNSRRAELTGTPLELLASPDYDVLGQIHPDDIEPALEIFHAAMPGRKPFSVFFRLRHEDGHYFPTRMRGLFVKEVYENQYPIFYAIYTDMSK